LCAAARWKNVLNVDNMVVVQEGKCVDNSGQQCLDVVYKSIHILQSYYPGKIRCLKSDFAQTKKVVLL